MNCSLSKNIDGTEFDIRPTSDDKIVIMHNATVNGTTNSKGKISDLTLEELRQLRYKTQFADQFLQRLFNVANRDRYFFKQYCKLGKQSSEIALFETVMKNFDRNKHMLIEIKGKVDEYSKQKQQTFEDNIVGILEENDYKNRNLTLESYNYEALFRIKDRLPDLKVIALVNRFGNLQPLNMGFDGVSLEYVLINEQVVEQVIKNNMMLYSWDDKTPIPHYKKISGLASEYKSEIISGKLPLYIINDFPEKAKEYVKIK